MAGIVPNTTSLGDIYLEDDLIDQHRRWKNLLASFNERYGRSPDFVSRSPGRVNIIGEVSTPFAELNDEIYTGWSRKR